MLMVSESARACARVFGIGPLSLGGLGSWMSKLVLSVTSGFWWTIWVIAQNNSNKWSSALQFLGSSTTFSDQAIELQNSSLAAQKLALKCCASWLDIFSWTNEAPHRLAVWWAAFARAPVNNIQLSAGTIDPADGDIVVWETSVFFHFQGVGSATQKLRCIWRTIERLVFTSPCRPDGTDSFVNAVNCCKREEILEEPA